MGKKKNKSSKAGPGVIATNRRARHDYNILETYEAGVQLVGTEIKSLREGKASLVEAFATVIGGMLGVVAVLALISRGLTELTKAIGK